MAYDNIYKHIAEDILALHPWNKYFGGVNAYWNHSSTIGHPKYSYTSPKYEEN